MIAFTVPGPPVPKGRARAFRVGAGIRMHTPKRTLDYEDAVGRVARGACAGRPLDVVDGEAIPLAVSIVAVLARVKRLDGRGKPQGRVWAHGSTVDADNVAKAVLDGMQRGGALVNDRHVVDVRCQLWYAAQGEAAHTAVTVERAADALLMAELVGREARSKINHDRRTA